MRYHRTISRVILVAAAGLLAAAGPPPTSARHAPAGATAVGPEVQVAPPAWHAVAAAGVVETQPTGLAQPAWLPVRRGDELAPRSMLRTGKRGRATLTRNASVLIVDPDSALELPERSLSGMETSVIQTSGSVLYEVDSRANPHFEVVTPYLIAGVKGTSFLVTVTEDYAAVTVERGLVEVLDTRTGHSFRVGAGESLLREAERDQPEHFGPQARRPPAARREETKLAEMDRRERERRTVADAQADRQRGLPGGFDDPDALDWVETADEPAGWGKGGKNATNLGGGKGAAGVGNTHADDVYEDLVNDIGTVGTSGPGQTKGKRP